MRNISSFNLSMLDELAKKSLKVHKENLEKFRQEYYSNVEKRASQLQSEAEKPSQ